MVDAELAYGARRAMVLARDALGAVRTTRQALPPGDLRAVALELAAGHLDDSLRELTLAQQGDRREQT
jgi:hypothetical protein